MKKELLETIDVTIENIFKWANNEFKQEKKSTSRDMLHQLDENFDDDKLKNEVFEKKLKVINHLSELMQLRIGLENIKTDK